MSNRKKKFSLLMFLLIIKLVIGELVVTDPYNDGSSTLSLGKTIRLKFDFTSSKIFQSCINMSAIIYAPKYSRFDGLCDLSSQFYECQINNNSITIRPIKCESYSNQDAVSIKLFVDYIPNKTNKLVAFAAYSKISSSNYEISNILFLQDALPCIEGSKQPQCSSNLCDPDQQFEFIYRRSLCLPCSPTCSKCQYMFDNNQLKCLTCNADYYLSTSYTCNKIIECSGNQFRINNMQCELCSKSCKTCEHVNYNCSSCQEGLYLAINYTADSYKINQLCMQIKSSESSIITFLPFSISFAFLTIFTLLSKFIYKPTIFRSTVCSLSGLLEGILWIFYSCYMVLNFQLDRIILNPTIYLLLAAIFTNTIFNFINIYLFLKYIFGDKTFKKQLISVSEKHSFFPYYITITSSIFFSHKIVELLFSKLFKIPSLSFKISSLNKLTPVTYIRYFSLLPSILAIAAAVFGKISFGNAENMFSLLTFDLIALTSISLLSTIWATQRSLQDYEAKTSKESVDLNENIVDQLQIIKTSKREQELQIRFSDIKRESLDEPSNKRRQRMQKQTTEGNLILSSQANSQEFYYNQIHVNAFEKDEINSLRDTRLTQINMQKRQSSQDRSSQRSDSADFEQFHRTPYNKNTRRIQGLYNRRRTNRSSRSLYSSEEYTNLSEKIEERFSSQQIRKLKILQNIQQIWQQIPENIKISINSLYNNSYRMTRSQIITSVKKLTNEQLNKLNEYTQFSIRQIQLSLSLLDEFNVTINQFFDYLNNLNRVINKENNANINNIVVDQSCKNSTKCHRYRANSNQSKQGKRKYPVGNNYSQSPYEIQSSGNQDEEISEFALGQKFSQKHLRKAQTKSSRSIKAGFNSPSRSNQPQPIRQVDKELETDKKAGPILSLEKKKSNITLSMDGIQRNLTHKFNSNVSKSSQNVRVDERRLIKAKIAQSIIIHENNHNEIMEFEEDQFANGVSVADVIQRYTNTQNDLIQKVPDENEKSYALPPRKSHRRSSSKRYAS